MSRVTIQPLSLTKLDGRFVNISGDTMTGTLNLPSNGLVVGTTELIVSGSNVGIGVSPLTKLHVNGTIRAINTVNVLNSASASSGTSFIAIGDSGGGRFRTDSGLTTLTATAFAFSSYVNGDYQDNVTIRVNGNVGIGITAPLALTHLQGAALVSDDARSQLIIADTTAATAGDGGGGILFRGNAVVSGAAHDYNAAFIRAYKINTTDGNSAFGMKLGTRPNGGSITTRVTVDDAGNVGVNTTPSTKFDVNGKARLRNQPACRVSGSGAQTITNDTATALVFDGELYDTDTMHDNSTNNTRITFTTAGVYTVGVHAGFTGNATGARNLYLRKNGTTIIAQEGYKFLTAGTQLMNTFTTARFAANDYVEALVAQDSGGSLDTRQIASQIPEFWATYLCD